MHNKMTEIERKTNHNLQNSKSATSTSSTASKGSIVRNRLQGFSIYNYAANNDKKALKIITFYFYPFGKKSLLHSQIYPKAPTKISLLITKCINPT